MLPSGIKALAGYVHNKGFKLGIYLDAGYIDLAQHVTLSHVIFLLFLN